MKKHIQTLESKTKSGVHFPFSFSLVPFGRHVEIITKYKSINKALFYVSKTI